MFHRLKQREKQSTQQRRGWPANDRIKTTPVSFSFVSTPKRFFLFNDLEEILMCAALDRSKTCPRIAQIPVLERAGTAMRTRNMTRWQGGWKRPSGKSHGAPLAAFRGLTEEMSRLLRAYSAGHFKRPGEQGSLG